MSIRAVIVDDEPLARQRLNRLLVELDVEVVAVGCDGAQAIDIVAENNVDILFIDINMPIKNGMDAAAEISLKLTNPPSIVFCTAYDEYALDAFNVSAIAYLLKPINIDELKSTLERVEKLNPLQKRELKRLQPEYLPINIDDSLENIKIEMIQYFRSLDKSVYAVIKGRGEILVGYTLKELELKLKNTFVRVHRSALVSVKYIRKLSRNESGASFVHIDDLAEPLQVSRRHLSEVKKCFQ